MLIWVGYQHRLKMDCMKWVWSRYIHQVRGLVSVAGRLESVMYTSGKGVGNIDSVSSIMQWGEG
jgi:hypothetical protein